LLETQQAARVAIRDGDQSNSPQMRKGAAALQNGDLH
jgi:hypothetical protein